MRVDQTTETSNGWLLEVRADDARLFPWSPYLRDYTVGQWRMAEAHALQMLLPCCRVKMKDGRECCETHRRSRLECEAVAHKSGATPTNWRV